MEVIYITTGYVKINTNDFDRNPVIGASVRVYKMEDKKITYEAKYTTNAKGFTENISLDAPPMELSLNTNHNLCPYATYNIEIIKSGFMIEERIGIQIFSNHTSSLTVVMLPSNTTPPKRNTIQIDDHSLFNRSGTSHA